MRDGREGGIRAPERRAPSTWLKPGQSGSLRPGARAKRVPGTGLSWWWGAGDLAGVHRLSGKSACVLGLAGVHIKTHICTLCVHMHACVHMCVHVCMHACPQQLENTGIVWDSKICAWLK